MAWVDNGRGGWEWRDDSGQQQPTPMPTTPPPSAGQTQQKPSSVPEGVTADSIRANQLNPDSPNYAGPGFALNPRWQEPGQPQLLLKDPLAQEQWKSEQALGAPPKVPEMPQATPSGPPAPAAPPMTPLERLRALEGEPMRNSLSPSSMTGVRRATPPTRAPSVRDRIGSYDPLTNAEEAPQPGDAAPDVDRSRIDPLLANVSTATSGLMGLAQIEEQSSRAEAQLRDAAARASQAALGQARGGNRRDRAFLERQAIAEGQFNQQQVGRDSALLRAQEEVDRNNLRLQAYRAAGELGLNASALELDVERIDIQSATNWINQEFENHRLGLQIDEQEAQRLANFARDMALIEQQYYTLSVQERQHIRDDLTRRHGISEQTRLAMAQLDAQDDWNWNTFASGIVTGGTTGFVSAILR